MFELDALHHKLRYSFVIIGFRQRRHVAPSVEQFFHVHSLVFFKSAQAYKPENTINRVINSFILFKRGVELQKNQYILGSFDGYPFRTRVISAQVKVKWS